MRSCFITISLLLSAFFVAAQKAKPPRTIYTTASQQYLTAAEADSLLYTTSSLLFKENGIPIPLLEKKYKEIKPVLVTMSRQPAIHSFNQIESNHQNNSFADIKKKYTDAFVKQLRITYATNRLLSQYLTFNTSDRITHFNSTVRVGVDGKLYVQEKITVNNGNGQPNPVYGMDSSLLAAGAMNNEIKRGIIRAFPLYYVNRNKLFQNTTFALKEVLRDGKKEDWHTEKHENGILVYTGSSNIFLEPGKYTYTISYTTDHQLKLLKEFDELYWNVTGNGWSFRIDSAKCTVILPKTATALSAKLYTGFQGETKEDGTYSTQTIGDSTVIVFKTTRPLLPKQGLTIAASWKKGLIKDPGTWENIKYFIWNNKAVFFLPLAALFSTIFCFICWLKYGRDPDKGAIHPQFEPPAGYSPAALGYIYQQGFSNQLTAATIVDAAVRNKIKIDVEREGTIFKHNEYHITTGEGPEKPMISSYEDFESDVEDLVDTTIEKGKYNSELGNLNSTVEKFCESNYKNKDGLIKKNDKGFFALNNSYTTIPGLVCIVAGIWAFFGGLVPALRIKNFWQIAYFIGGIILCWLVIKLFSKLMRAYSPAGRLLKDKIEGFRMFISATDENRFDTMNPPKKSLELYEKYLPFAIALGCAIEWGKQFEEIINTASIGGATISSFSRSLSNDRSFSSSFASSFSGAISSASSPPSSSSGGGSSFGGGSSGGGGGGGGGGGW